MTATAPPATGTPGGSFDLATAAPATYRAMLALTETAAQGLDPALAELVRVRVSQLNGCAFCLDLHAGAARRAGESERRLTALPAWRRTPFFTHRERAALALAEAATTLVAAEEALLSASAHFTHAELAQLLWTIAAVNAWNRVAVPLGLGPGPDGGPHAHA